VIARFPNGVDLDIFNIALTREEARNQLKLPTNTFIALYTGNFTTYGEDKGVADCIRSLKHLHDDVLFIAVGGNPDDCARYGKLAKEERVAARVRLIGNVQQTELAVYQKAADVLLMPYPDHPHYRNNMSPMKMFEYMAADRPILASDLPTIREILTDDNAYIVPPDAPEAIAAALQEIRENPDEADRRAHAAYAAAPAYSWKERAQSIIRLILVP
jgi:glycosyltransferase involved in cell wall biosynthesis